MIWHGRIKDGTVVVDDPAGLPAGGRVRIELLSAEVLAERTAAPGSLGAQLLELAGRAQGLPMDAARRHDEYLEESAPS